MTFNVLAIGRPDDPDLLEYPSIGVDLQLTPEPLDGAHPIFFSATGFRVQRFDKRRQKFVTASQAEKLTLDCRITASRVAIYCRKFDKGGGWWGDPASMLVLNAGSKLLAAARRHGKALVGHLRYPWIRTVLFHPKTGMLSSEFLRFRFNDGTDDVPTTCLLDVVLHRSEDSSRLAWEVVQRSIAYRYTSGEELNADEVSGFEAIRAGGIRRNVDSDGSGFGQYQLPSAFNACGGMGTVPAVAPPPLDRIPAYPGVRLRGASAAGPAAAPPKAAPPLAPAPVSPAPPAPLQPGQGTVAAVADPARPRPLEEPPAVPLSAEAQVGSVPQAVPSPCPTLHFDTGEVVASPAFVIVGRNPIPDVADGVAVLLVAIDDPSRSISKTHMSLDLRRDGVTVVDRYSTNGVAVEFGGGASPCAPGVPTEVPAGATVRFGERSVLVAQSSTATSMDAALVGAGPAPEAPVPADERSYCAQCGAPRGSGRFCGACGVEHSQTAS